jgi:hypothetical protein
MKKCAVKLGLFSIVLLGVVSCKSKESEVADEKVKALETYVDSLKTVGDDEMMASWDKISTDFDQKVAEANEAIVNLNDEEKAVPTEKVDAVSVTYVTFKTNVSEKQAAMKPNPNQLLRDQFFGSGKIGEDMNFSWVNKDNILSTYEKFFQSYKDNKENFSREDYDEVKLMYEALDSRKNTVENEGLSSDDNGKIASIKFKFAPMFKMNRIGAKSREMEAAKE